MKSVEIYEIHTFELWRKEWIGTEWTECVQYASQRGMRGMRGRRARRARHEQNMRGMRGMNNPQHKLLTVKLTGELFKLTWVLFRLTWVFFRLTWVPRTSASHASLARRLCMPEWTSQLCTQLKQLRNKRLEKIQAWTGFQPMTSALLVKCSTNWAIKPTGSWSFCV